MQGRTGMTWRRACGPLLLVAVAGLGACGDGSGTDMVRAAMGDGVSGDDVEAVGARPSPPSTIEGATLLDGRTYDPGDCIVWSEGGPGEVEEPEVVDCTLPHRVQITERLDGPDGDDYPTIEAWERFIETACRPAAERYIGRAVDPYGRLYPTAILPTEEGWTVHRRTASCAVGIHTADGLAVEDARTADQAVRYAPGDCVLDRPGAASLVVPCDQAHHREITAQLDLSDLAAAPDESTLGARCRPTVDAYLGHPPVAPWLGGQELVRPESWEAGTRITHCFVGQWDAAGELVAVTGSARG